jgi:hypothetical protein
LCFVAQSRLFKVVSFITGFKNSMKGIGYFIGAAALSFNYYFALGILLLLVLAAMPWAIVGLSNQLGRCAKRHSLFVFSRFCLQSTQPCTQRTPHSTQPCTQHTAHFTQHTAHSTQLTALLTALGSSWAPATSWAGELGILLLLVLAAMPLRQHTALHAPDVPQVAMMSVGIMYVCGCV